MNHCDYCIIASKADLYHLCPCTPIRRFERRPGRRDPDLTSRPCGSLANCRGRDVSMRNGLINPKGHSHLIRNLGATDVEPFDQQYSHPGLQVVTVQNASSRSAQVSSVPCQEPCASPDVTVEECQRGVRDLVSDRCPGRTGERRETSVRVYRG
jgi:hypothetical protein